METTLTLITNLLSLFQQLPVALEQRNRWTLAAMVALLLKGKRAHLYELGNALPCSGKEASGVHTIRRWLANPRITPAGVLPVFLRVFAVFLAQLSWSTLIIDRTEWQRRGKHLNLLLCSVVYHSRSFPLYWTLLPTRGCSSLAGQHALLTPVLAALTAHPLLAAIPRRVLADRAFCAPRFAQWLTRQHVRYGLRVKKSSHIARLDIPATPLRLFLTHCDQNTYDFFALVTLTAASRLPTNLFLYWRPDCAEPLARMTDLTESAALPGISHLTVIHGHLDDLRQPHPPLKKRRWSLFAHARQIFQDVCDRKPCSVVIRFFQHFFTFLGQVLSHTTLEDDMAIFLKFSKQQHALLQ